MCRLSCKGKEDEKRHEDGLRIDPRAEVFIYGAKEVEEGVAPIDPSLTLILKGGGREWGCHRRERDRTNQISRYSRQLLLSEGFYVLVQSKLLS